jgi:hypothetical protein
MGVPPCVPSAFDCAAELRLDAAEFVGDVGFGDAEDLRDRRVGVALEVQDHKRARQLVERRDGCAQIADVVVDREPVGIVYGDRAERRFIRLALPQVPRIPVGP